MTARPWPVELRVSADRARLAVVFDDGARFDLPSEYLRVMTPSAEDRGHGAGPGRTVAGKRAVTLSDVRPVGRYAVRLVFSDGHDTGLYSWDELRRLGEGEAKIWNDYLGRLEAEGRSRDG